MRLELGSFLCKLPINNYFLSSDSKGDKSKMIEDGFEAQNINSRVVKGIEESKYLSTVT